VEHPCFISRLKHPRRGFASGQSAPGTLRDRSPERWSSRNAFPLIYSTWRVLPKTSNLHLSRPAEDRVRQTSRRSWMPRSLRCWSRKRHFCELTVRTSSVVCRRQSWPDWSSPQECEGQQSRFPCLLLKPPASNRETDPPQPAATTRWDCPPGLSGGQSGRRAQYLEQRWLRSPLLATAPPSRPDPVRGS